MDTTRGFLLFSLALAIVPQLGWAGLDPAFPTKALSTVSGTDHGHEPPLTCDRIVRALLDIQKDRTAEDAAEMKDFYDNVTVMQAWYDHYSVYEGESVYVTPGTFQPLQTSAVIEEQNASSFNSAKVSLQERLDRVMAVLPTCLK